MKTHLPTVLWAGLIGLGLLTPERQLARVGSLPDWAPVLAHFFLFLGLALLLCRSLAAASGGRLRARQLAAAFGIALLYGAALEIAQLGVEGRDFEWLDLILNGLGALAGVAGAGMAARAGSRFFNQQSSRAV